MAAAAGTIYSVSQITNYISAMFQEDYLLGRVSVRGEISNCKYHTSGHIYFTIKDENALITCILFAGSRSGLTFRLAEGMRVIVSGRIGIYRQGGSYHLYASAVKADGTGALYERYEALKKELAEMGMFDDIYKKPIPKYINTLGVVTAPTGAAVRDIIQIAKRRHPGIRILLYPAKVQGEGASSSIAEGIRVLEAAGVDVIIAGRGGGSIEDLWAFNEEETAKAFFSCSVPIISAVGHETDTVITDYVADLRAPTPSAAAELAVADMSAVSEEVENLRKQVNMLMQRHIGRYRERLEREQKMLFLLSPKQRVFEMRMRLEDRSLQLQAAMDRLLLLTRNRVQLCEERLKALSYREKLASGMALVEGNDGKLKRYAADLTAGEEIAVIFYDGTRRAKVL